MLSSLLVCDNIRNMSSSTMLQFGSRIRDTGSDSGVTAMEQTLIKVTKEVVRRTVGLGLDAPAAGRQFDCVYQIVVEVYNKYRTQLEQLVNMLTLTDLTRIAESLDRVLDSLFVDGQITSGRVATVLAFAGCVVQNCIENEIISSDDIDQLVEVIGRQLASRLINTQYNWEEFGRFVSKSSFFEDLPWRSIAFTLFSLGALTVFFSIH